MFKKVEFFSGKELSGWQPFLKELSEDNTRGILLFVAEETPFDYQRIQPLLKELKIEVWGGVFPQVIYDGSLYKQGVVGCTLRSPISIEVIKDLGGFAGDLPENFISKNTRTLLVLYDGCAYNVPLLIETLYEISPPETTFIGGGAGSFTNIGQPSLFTTDDFFAGGAIIAALESHLSLGIDHGWQPINEDVAIASKVDRRTLRSINWESAFEYYKNIVEKDAGIELTAGNFAEVARSYPLGMLRYDGEIILRVALSVDAEDNILLGSEMPENSMLIITKGYPEKLIEAAGRAAEQARTAFETRKKITPQNVLVVDCITRALFLKNRFEDELRLIKSRAGGGVFPFGFLSLGEIASTGDKYVELYNKTVVIGMGE
ncbi:MAG TPA: hypothetical protein DCY61_02595 [Dehalococcoidia bacterium]|nr:hypothetical protein [Dehalococcoidia bacterium]